MTELVNNNEPFVKSAFGFRSIKPRNRIERRGMKDKVLLEKSRIALRVGHAARMQKANAPATSAGLTSCEENAAGYISNADRFHSDTAGEEYENRQVEIGRQKQGIEFRNRQAREREDNRWCKLETDNRADEEYWHKVRDEGVMAKKNVSNVAYDITNLQYNQDIYGEEQKYVDDMVRYRAAARSRNLSILADTRAPYNIINGGGRYIPPVPDTIDPPNSNRIRGGPIDLRRAPC
jgi:hypothetical protein